MFELKLTFQTADALYAAVAKLSGEATVLPGTTLAAPVLHPVPESAPAPVPADAEKKKPGRPKKEPLPHVAAAVETIHAAHAAAVSAATGAAEQDPVPAPQPEPELAPGVLPTGDDVKAAAEALNAKVGIVKLKSLLAEFQASRISEVRVEDRAAFITRAKEICA